jgi:hypothetical protein
MSFLMIRLRLQNEADSSKLKRTMYVNDKKPPLASWKLVYVPKNRGGLGVIRLSLQNEALLMKNLDKFFSKANLPWVRLVWSQYYLNGAESLVTE